MTKRVSKIKKFTALGIRKITGGKDPVRQVEEFILQLGFDPKECQKGRAPEHIRWMVTISEGQELEVLLESLQNPQQMSVYMGLNVLPIPLRSFTDTLVAALEIADGLVGIKVSLVGHFLVLSATLGASGVTVEDLDYHYKLITAQQEWFKSTLSAELQLEMEETP